MIHDIINDSKSRMEKSLITLKSELIKLRTSRVHPSLLEHIKIDYYNITVPLSQAATISVENPRTLLITPWEKHMIDPIQKAIKMADLGLNPATIGIVIRVPFPPLTEERRKELARVMRNEAERARVAIRNIRREANNHLKKLIKEKKISEDEEYYAQTTIQKLTDIQIAEIGKITSQKEADLIVV